MADKREQLERLLKLYRKGHLSEELLLDQIQAVAGEQGGENGSVDADVDEAAQAESIDVLERQNRLADILDRFRAAEQSGARTLVRWAELTEDPALIGGLRAVAARESAHAALLAERLTELGAQPEAEVPSWLASFNNAIVSPSANDVERLGALVAQLGDSDQAFDILDEAIELAAGDALSRELLLAIRSDELATIDWFRMAYDSRKNPES